MELASSQGITFHARHPRFILHDPIDAFAWPPFDTGDHTSEAEMEGITDLLSGCKLEAVAHRNATMLLKTTESTSVKDAVQVRSVQSLRMSTRNCCIQLSHCSACSVVSVPVVSWRCPCPRFATVATCLRGLSGADAP